MAFGHQKTMIKLNTQMYFVSISISVSPVYQIDISDDKIRVIIMRNKITIITKSH